MLKDRKPRKDVIDEYRVGSRWSFSSWDRHARRGTAFAALAGAGKTFFSGSISVAQLCSCMTGTLYLLVILAASGTLSLAKKLAVNETLSLAHFLRQPPGAFLVFFSLPLTLILSYHFLRSDSLIAKHVLGSFVIDYLIPTINLIRRRYPLTFSTMFSHKLLVETYLPADFLTSSTAQSDTFFRKLAVKYVSMAWIYIYN